MLIRDLIVDWRIGKVAGFQEGRGGSLGKMSKSVRQYWVERLKCDPTEIACQVLREWRWKRNFFLTVQIAMVIFCLGFWWWTGRAFVILSTVGLMETMVVAGFLFLQWRSTNSKPVNTFFDWATDITASLDIFRENPIDNLLGMEMNAIKEMANWRLVNLAAVILVKETKVEKEASVAGEIRKHRKQLADCMRRLNHCQVSNATLQSCFDAARELQWVKKTLEAATKAA